MNLPDTRNGSGRTCRLALRLGLFALVAGLAAAALWHVTRPKPVMVVIARVDAGRVENTVANTRAGSVMACRRGKLALRRAPYVHLADPLVRGNADVRHTGKSRRGGLECRRDAGAPRRAPRSP